MRIVVNGWFADQMNTGSGQYLASLAAVMPRAGEAHDFVLAERQRHEPGGRFPEGWRVVHVATPFDRLHSDLAKVWFEQVTFPRLCVTLRADVAFVPYWGSPWVRPCPVVVTVHDLIPLLLPLYRGGMLQRLYTWLVSATVRRAHAVITDSAASRRDIVAHLGIAPERVHAVHLAAEGCVAENVTAAGLAGLRSRLGLPDRPFLLYLGGFDARKNVIRTLEAYAKLVTTCTGKGIEAPLLVVAGMLPADDSTFAPDPRPVVRSLGLSDRVHFTGWVNEADKAQLYALATGVLFVSEYEGFGLPVLEAMACDRAPLVRRNEVTRG